MSSFKKDYWDHNYSSPQTMDGIGNAKDHAKYLKSFMDLELVDISSIVDLGFGYGYLFQKMMKVFVPYRACGVEPSKYAFDKARARKLKPVDSTKLELLNESIQEWCERSESKKMSFDLALCNSVFQYRLKNSSLMIPMLFGVQETFTAKY
jgi:SAM-dependent methyltransferase